MVQPTHEEYREHHPASRQPPGARGDPYERNLAGLIGFNPVLPGLRRALGPHVEVEQPIMWPGPEVELHRAGLRRWGDAEQWVRIKLDMAGTTHSTNRGQEISDQRAAELLGISEHAFSRGHELAAIGMRAGEAAMDLATRTGPYEVVEACGPERRLAAAQRRDIPPQGPPSHIASGRTPA